MTIPKPFKMHDRLSERNARFKNAKTTTTRHFVIFNNDYVKSW